MQASRQDEIFAAFTILSVAMRLWIASGSLTTKQFTITKKSLWRSRTLGWGDITEIHLYKKQEGTIEFRADSQKLVIDFRIMAFDEQLLREIEDRTHMQSFKSSSQKVILPSPGNAGSECGFSKNPSSLEARSRALAQASTPNQCASLKFIFLEEAEELDTPSDGLGRSL